MPFTILCLYGVWGLRPYTPCFFCYPYVGVTASLRGLSALATAFVASQHAYNLLCKLLTSHSRPKDACASALWKPAHKLFIKVLQNAGVRIMKLADVTICCNAFFRLTSVPKKIRGLFARLADSRQAFNLALRSKATLQRVVHIRSQGERRT